MGAWGSGPFENDAALDWLAVAEGDASAVEAALGAVDGVVDYLEVDDGAAALAAATVVAAATDGEVEGLPPEARSLALSLSADAAIRQLTVVAVERVRGTKSELASLWGDDPTSTFQRDVDRLLVRLR